MKNTPLLLLLLGLAPSVRGISDPSVYLVPQPGAGKEQALRVDVFVDNIVPENPLLGFGFKIDFSPHLTWDLDATRTGPAFDDVSSQFRVPDPFNPGEWVLDVAGNAVSDAGPTPVFGDGILLATLVFQTPPAPFTAFVAVSASRQAQNEGLFTRLAQYGIPTTSVTIDVPEISSTALLLALGVASLGVCRLAPRLCKRRVS